MEINSTDQHPRPKAPTPASWKPGQSGNVRGRPRKGNALTEAIRERVDPVELAEIAIALARGGESESTRLQALGWLRDSAYQRPAERHEFAQGTPDDEDDAVLDGLSVEQLRALQAAEREHEERRAAIIALPLLVLAGGKS